MRKALKNNTMGRLVPILVIDVWEYACRLKHKNKIAQFVDRLLEIINRDNEANRFMTSNSINKPEKMNLKITTLLGLAFLVSTLTYAQEHKDELNPKWDFGLEGMLGFAAGKDFYAFNVGGPSLMLRLNEDLKVGVGALPSFYIKEGKTGAKLGVSPRIDFKNIALIAPFFHFEGEDKWVWSIGLGYKFHRKTKEK